MIEIDTPTIATKLAGSLIVRESARFLAFLPLALLVDAAAFYWPALFDSSSPSLLPRLNGISTIAVMFCAFFTAFALTLDFRRVGGLLTALGVLVLFYIPVDMVRAEHIDPAWLPFPQSWSEDFSRRISALATYANGTFLTYFVLTVLALDFYVGTSAAVLFGLTPYERAVLAPRKPSLMTPVRTINRLLGMPAYVNTGHVGFLSAFAIFALSFLSFWLIYGPLGFCLFWSLSFVVEREPYSFLQSVPTGAGWGWLLPRAVLAFGSVWIGLWLRASARRLAMRAAQKNWLRDRRPPIVFLRGFIDEQISLPLLETGGFGWFLSVGRRNLTLDELLIEECADFASVIAVANPAARTKSYGAIRLSFNEESWRSHVEQLCDRAAAIVMCIGPSQGVRWEISHLFEKNHDAKTLFLVRPVDGLQSSSASTFAFIKEMAANREHAHILDGDEVQRPSLGFFALPGYPPVRFAATSYSQLEYTVAVRCFLRAVFRTLPPDAYSTSYREAPAGCSRIEARTRECLWRMGSPSTTRSTRS